MTYGKLSYSLLIGLALGGCAQQQIGPQASFDSGNDSNAPLQVSASFLPVLCSDQIGYLAFSMHNPSNEFYTLNQAELKFDLDQDNQYRVLAGKELLAWADAQSNLSLRNEHNTNLARLAAVSVTRLIAGSSDDTTTQAFASGVSAVTAAMALDESAQLASIPPGTSSNHLYEDQLLVPPGMSRTFWVALQALPEAPLLHKVSVSYQDNQQQTQQFNVKINDWQSCSWQQQRIANLRQWGVSEGLVTVRRSSNGSNQYLSHDLLELERQYQQQHELASGH